MSGTTVRKMALASLMSILLLMGVSSSFAVGEYTAAHLLELYDKARADLLNMLAAYGGGTGAENLTENLTGTVTVTEPLNSTLTLNETSIELEAGSGEGGETPHCADIYSKVMSYVQLADQYAEAAKASLSAGNYKLAATQALKALNIIGEIYVRLSICLGTQSGLTSEEMDLSASGNESMPLKATGNLTVNATLNYTHTHMAPGLLSAILRHEIRLSRLKATIQAAEDSGMNVSDAWDLASKVEETLDEAKELTLSGDANGAARLLAEANKLMAEIVKILKTSSAVAIEHRKRHSANENGTNISVSEEMNKTNKTKEMNKTKTERGKNPVTPPGWEKKDHDKGTPPTETERGKGHGNHGKGHQENEGGES